ncbi:MAG TPA: anthranilate phosphoribosyltransferase [Gemmatimonadota bacterium]|nr:anthranilate phosphoribosyltransferase [Gemmatimonadota bacterium]
MTANHGTGLTDSMRSVLDGASLTEAEAEAALERLASGSLDPAAAGAFLAALKLKGETSDEIRGFARGMRRLAIRPVIVEAVRKRAVDVVGTGGDGSGSLNLSTGSALLAAAAGVPIVKHGNRSITSRSGSADVLERLGLPMPLDPDAAGRCLEQTGFTFLFAPRFHPAMKHVAPVRRALGVRTIFNLLGPLTNPAAPPYHVVGAWAEDVAARMADVLSGLPIVRAFVVHGEPGWDEATPCGPFTLFDVEPGRVRREIRDPVDLGLARCAPDALLGGDAEDNARALRAALGGARGAHRDALALGAALALEVSGTARNAAGALEAAKRAIDDGSAARLLDRLSAFGASGTNPTAGTLSAGAATRG